MDPAEMSQLKAFLLLFNKLSERCFQRCVYTLGQPTLTSDEATCIDTCLTKNVNFNQKLMSLYMEINPPFQQKKMEEQMAKVQELQEAQGIAANANANVGEVAVSGLNPPVDSQVSVVEQQV